MSNPSGKIEKLKKEIAEKDIELAEKDLKIIEKLQEMIILILRNRIPADKLPDAALNMIRENEHLRKLSSSFINAKDDDEILLTLEEIIEHVKNIVKPWDIDLTGNTKHVLVSSLLLIKAGLDALRK